MTCGVALPARALGDVLTRAIIAEGRAIILNEFGLRNESPYFPPLFLTFFDHPEFIGPTDDALRRMRAKLSQRDYGEFASRTQGAPMGGLFELNVYSALDLAFSGVVPQPKLPDSTKKSDALISVDGTSVYVEATALAEPESTTRRSREMHARGQKVWAYFDSPDGRGAGRIVRKIADELNQTAENTPNILCLSFFDEDPSPPVRGWAIADAWLGAPAYGGATREGTPHDLSRISRIDSIFEFGRKRLLKVHVNPTATDACRVPDATRERIRAAFDGDLMIR